MAINEKDLLNMMDTINNNYLNMLNVGDNKKKKLKVK